MSSVGGLQPRRKKILHNIACELDPVYFQTRKYCFILVTKVLVLDFA